MAKKEQTVVRTYPRWTDVRDCNLERSLSRGFRVVACNSFAYSFDEDTGTVVLGNEYILERERDE